MALTWEQVNGHHECWWSENDWTLQIWQGHFGYWFRAVDETRTVYSSESDGQYFDTLHEARVACEEWVLGEVAE